MLLKVVKQNRANELFMTCTWSSSFVYVIVIGDLGLWSSPLMKGSRPPLRDRFSLIVTDEDQAVMFGGRTLSDESSEAHVLHLPTMVRYL